MAVGAPLVLLAAALVLLAALLMLSVSAVGAGTWRSTPFWARAPMQTRYFSAMPTPIALERHPLDVDVHDDEEVRRWLASCSTSTRRSWSARRRGRHRRGPRGDVIRIVGEVGGRRAERAIILAPKPGKPGDAMRTRSPGREFGPVPAGEGWDPCRAPAPGELIMTVLWVRDAEVTAGRAR